MERNREVKRASIVSSNGFNRRRLRTNHSQDEDEGVELQRTKRDRERERERDLRSKRRTGERLMSNREDETSDDDDNDTSGLTPPSTAAAAISNHSHHSNNYMNSVNHQLQHRKSFPPSSSSKIFSSNWKHDEIINVSVPRKARSASMKRLHDWTSNSSNNNSSGGGEKANRQASTSPARHGGAPTAPISPPSSSNRKKLKCGGSNGGAKVKPPKAAAKQSSSNVEELEIEIAEVLYGLMTQSQGGPSSRKEDSREVDRSTGGGSSPISHSDSATKRILGPNSVAPKRKKSESSTCGGAAKLDKNQTAKSGISSPVLEKTSRGPEAAAPPPDTAAAEELRESRDSALQEKEFTLVRNEGNICMDTTVTGTASAASTMIKENVMVCDLENRRQQKLEIDLMTPPPQIRSSQEREIKIHLGGTDQKSLSFRNRELECNNEEDEKRKIAKKQSQNAALEAGLKKEIENKGESVLLQLYLEKPSKNGIAKANREEPLFEKSSQSKGSLPLHMPMASWPCGLPSMGYMAPLQGVVSMEGGAVAPVPMQPLFSQPRPKRCATHSYIARSIHCLQQVIKMNPFWHMAANVNLMHDNALDKGNDLAGNLSHGGREKVSQDSSQRKQILINQPMPPAAATNLLGPAFIFPFNQQQTASARPSSTKSPPVGQIIPTSDPSPMSLNYPAVAANETQYLAILQNNGYPYPIQGIGAPPGYRNLAHPASFSGSFYSSQMIHPSQVQQAQPNSSSSSQKHVQQSNNRHPHLHPPQPRFFEGDVVSEGSPSRTGNPGSRAFINIYGQNYAMPMQPHNFSLMSPPAASGSCNQSEKKQQQQQQQQSLVQHGFAMSFGAINGANTGSGIDPTSMTQNHAMQMMAQAAQKKQLRLSEDEKCDSITSASSAQANCVNVVESSARSLNIASVTARSLRPATSSPLNIPNAHLQQQHLATNAANRSKAAGTSTGSLFNEYSIMAAKFQTGLVHGSTTSPSPSPRSSTRIPVSSQQHNQTQISFGGNHKPYIGQGQNRALSPPVAVTSPTISSVSRGASGSPRTTTSASTNTKIGQNSSILGQASSLSSGDKHPEQQQPPMTMQQAQLFFSSAYSEAQSPHHTGMSSPGVFYMQRRWPDQQQQPSVVAPMRSSTAMNDPAKAIVAAAANGALLAGSFTYPHQVPAAAQVKPAEQKQPAG